MSGFGVLLFCNLIHAVSVMLPLPTRISALCICHVVIGCASHVSCYSLGVFDLM